MLGEDISMRRVMIDCGRTRKLSLVGIPAIFLGWLAFGGDAFRPQTPTARVSGSLASARAVSGDIWVARRTLRRRDKRLTAMKGDAPSERRDFVKTGLTFLFGSAAAAMNTKSVSAEESDEMELSDEAKQRIMDAIVEALTGGTGDGSVMIASLNEDDESMDESKVGRSKDVLDGSPEVLPNRTPFEMQYEMFKRGMELEDDNDYIGAEKQWTEIIENFNSPNFRATSSGNKLLLARAYNNRGNTRLSLQKTREAILDYSESIDLFPENGEFWLARGVAYEDMADRKVLAAERNAGMARTFYESALSDYDHALVLDPQDPKVYISRGDANTLLGQAKAALDNYRRAVSLSPMIPEFRGKVALAELEVGNTRRGAYLIGQLLQRYPRYPEMLLAGAAVAWEEGALVEGQEMYSRAVHGDARLLDDDFIWLILRWPEQPLNMVKTIRAAARAPKGSGLDALGLPALLEMPREII